MELGRRLGNYVGGRLPTHIRDIVGVDAISSVILKWEDDGRVDSNNHIFMDRELKKVSGRGTDEDLLSAFDENRHYYEVLAAGPFNSDEPADVLRKYLEEGPQNRVALSWDHPDEVDVAEYRVYAKLGAGSFALVATVTETRYLTDALAEGSWTFRVDPVDAAGNQLTSSMTTVVVVPASVEPPSLPVTVGVVSDGIVRVSWGASPTTSLDAYNVYSNGGSGDPDLDTPWASVGGGVLTATGSAPSAGDWIFIVRAVKAGEEEDNFDRRVDARIETSPYRIASALPKPVSFLAAEIESGGFFQVSVTYNTINEPVVGSLVNVYIALEEEVIDFGGGPEETLVIPGHELGKGGPYLLQATLGPYAENESYQIEVRVESIEGVEEEAGLRVIVTSSDATPPVDVGTLSGELY